MKTEDATLDQIVWQCQTTDSSDLVSLRKGIVVLNSDGEFRVKALGVYIRGDLRVLRQGDQYLTHWHASIHDAVTDLRRDYDNRAMEGHGKLNELLISVRGLL